MLITSLLISEYYSHLVVRRMIMQSLRNLWGVGGRWKKILTFYHFTTVSSFRATYTSCSNQVPPVAITILPREHSPQV